MKKLLFIAVIFMAFCSIFINAQRTEPVQGTIDYNGIKFKYVREGKGDPLVVVGSSVYYSKAFSKNLKEKFEMIFVDSRHFIPTYEPAKEDLSSLTFKIWADDLEMIRQKLNLGKITVVGHSVHGQIALEYANRYPTNTSGLILIGGMPYAAAEFSDQVNDYWSKEADENRKSVLSLNMQKIDSLQNLTPENEKFAVINALMAPKIWVDPKHDASFLLKDLLTSPKAYEVLSASIPSKQEVIDKLIRLKMPALIICGKFDFFVPYSIWQSLVQNTPIDYVLMQNAGHTPQSEDVSVNEFDDIVINWMSKNK